MIKLRAFLITVGCPVGTYQPIGREDCLQCPRGYFNSKEAQLSCTKCPSDKTTNATGAEAESYCLSTMFHSSLNSWWINLIKLFLKYKKTTNLIGWLILFLDPCKPGFYSATGLDPCESCPKGQFQNDFGRTSCKQCPEKTTTSKRGAVHIQDCQGKTSITDCASLANPLALLFISLVKHCGIYMLTIFSFLKKDLTWQFFKAKN